MNPETPIQQRIRLEAGGRNGARLFRNNVGVAEFPDGTKVVYGLTPGSSDLIGWRTITITADMVGTQVARFVAIEVKSPGAKTGRKRLELQKNFIAAVRRAGGLAGFATSSQEASEILNG